MHHVVSLAGGALALNLAYVNLERFRYANAIQNISREVLDRVENAEGIDFTHTRSYRQLQELVTFPRRDRRDETSAEVSGAGLRFLRLLYGWIFVKPTDMFICSILVIASVLALALGSGHPIGVLMGTCAWFTREHIHLSYWILASGILVPMVFLALGTYIKWTCSGLADRIHGDLGAVLKKAVPDAKINDETD